MQNYIPDQDPGVGSALPTVFTGSCLVGGDGSFYVVIVKYSQLRPARNMEMNYTLAEILQTTRSQPSNGPSDCLLLFPCQKYVYNVYNHV